MKMGREMFSKSAVSHLLCGLKRRVDSEGDRYHVMELLLFYVGGKAQYDLKIYYSDGQ